MAIDPDLKRLANGKSFAALTTLGADGSPSTHMMWVGADDDHVLINTEVHRQKYKNTARDPRVCITVIDSESAYKYVEARGRVIGEVRGQEARDDIDVLSNRYTGHDYATPVQSERVILKIAVDKVHKNNL
jgi:PPOX class probable F420-dependent enzyme